MKLLREYIRALLAEAAKVPADLPEGVFVEIVDQGEHAAVRYVEKNSDDGRYYNAESLDGRVAIMRPDHP